MRIKALAMILVSLAACGDVGTAERLSSRETLDGIDVPTIGTVGDYPPAQRRHVVNVTADGRIVLDGATLTFDALAVELKRRVDLAPGEQILGAKPARWISGDAVVLRIDGALTWGAALDLYVASSLAGFRFVTFAVRHETDGAEGALAVFGSTMGDHGDRNSVVDDVEATRGVFAVVAPGDGSPAAVHATLAASKPPGLAGLDIDLDVDPRLPTRTALAILDASLRAGARWGRFIRPGAGTSEAAPEDERVCKLEDFATELARPRVAETTYALVFAVDGKNGTSPLSVRPAAPMPPVARVRGRAAGITWGRDRYEPR